MTRGREPHRIATLSVHTSPLEQPGGGDAGGMNVFIAETSRRMAERGVEVEIFTRATSSDLPPVVEMGPGVLVRHIIAGPFEGLGKNELPAQMCAFSAGVLRVEAANELGYFAALHSHYWLSGQVGWLARDRWRVPLVHSAHTLAKVKNASLADGDVPEPRARVLGEEQVVVEADRLVASTGEEARELIELYDADPAKVTIVAPGVDLDLFTPSDQVAARARLGIQAGAVVLLFVGRIQPLKAPDVLLRAAARMLAGQPSLRARLRVIVVGGPSGNGCEHPEQLSELAAELGIADVVDFVPPTPPHELVDYYRAADVCAVPSYNESFGLVALEAQACGTPVVAAAVGGLPTAVADGQSGLLVSTHDADDWAGALRSVAMDPARRAVMSTAAVRHAAGFSWDSTADQLLAAYREAMTGPLFSVGEVVS